MLKKKSTSKKKKSVNTPATYFPYQDRSDPATILKLTGSMLPKSNIPYHKSRGSQNQHQHGNKLTMLTKPTKSSNITPSNKSRKQSKENLYQSAFHSTKNSATITPFDFLCGDQSVIVESKKNRSRAQYRFLYQVGSGGFGRVWKVEDKKDRNIYAMKEMSKAKILMKKSVSSVINQKQLLEELKNPFIINAHTAFQDRENLYLVMEYLRGGDLRYHMCFCDYFDEQQTKFIVACIILSLEYIHSHRVIHRDLKPQNIVFQESGYVHITDFGVARKYREHNADDTSGTPGYMAPEVICRMNHSYEVDFFALGVIMYELMLGIRPYMGDSRKEIRQKILAHQAKLHEWDLPRGWNPSCIDFVNKLIKRNKQSRLGYGGISEIKTHPWLRSVNWDKLYKKELKPSFIPGIVSESRQYQQQMQNSCLSEINEEASVLLRTDEIQKLFKNYEAKKRSKILKSHKKHGFY